MNSSRQALPFLGLPTRPAESIRNLAGVLDALAPAAEVARLVLLVAEFHVWDLDGHGGIVQHDRQNRNARADRRLEIEACHAEGRIAHEVDAEFLGRSDLGADHQHVGLPGSSRRA
jgi:hypothetical protein